MAAKSENEQEMKNGKVYDPARLKDQKRMPKGAFVPEKGKR